MHKFNILNTKNIHCKGKYIIISVVLIVFALHTAKAQSGQVGINTPSPKATLHVLEANVATKPQGIIAPNVTLAELNAAEALNLYGTAQISAIVYVKDITGTPSVGQTQKVTAIGYYYFDGSIWQILGTGIAPTSSGIDLTQANNGLHETGDTVQLGGALIKPTTITTDGTNTLAIEGLQTGAYADSVVMAGTGGVLRKLPVDSINKNDWHLTGNTLGTPDSLGAIYLGTNDNNDLVFKRNGVQAGWINLGSATVPRPDTYSNTAFGLGSLSYNANNLLTRNNTAIGYQNLSVTVGHHNTAVGVFNLPKNTTGYSNTAIGSGNLFENLTGYQNVAIGLNNIIGSAVSQDNIAIGNNNLVGVNMTANARWNIGIGETVLPAVINGSHNIGMGREALNNIKDGYGNVGIGFWVLHNAEMNGGAPTANIAIGYRAGFDLDVGSRNIMIGDSMVQPSVTSVSNEMNIGNLLFGTGINKGRSGTLPPLYTFVPAGGKIGINTNAPQQALHVHGQARIDTLLSGTLTDSIVTADGSGNLRRISPSRLIGSGGGGNVTANNGLHETSDTVQLGGTLIKHTEIAQNNFNLYTTGNGKMSVGAAPTTGSSKFEVNGASTNTKAYDAGNGTTIDFTQSNLARTTNTALAGFTLDGMKDGGTYTLAVQQNTTAAIPQSGFTATDFTIFYANSTGTAAGRRIYTILCIGSEAYIYVSLLN
jgi:hypothetical protein